MKCSNRSISRLIAASLLASCCAMFLTPAYAVNSGLDTPTGVGDLPFSVEGVEVMDLTQPGLTISGNLTVNIVYANDLTTADNNNSWAHRLWLANGDGNHFLFSTGSGGNQTVLGEYGAWFGIYDTSNGEWAGYFYGDQNLTVGSGSGPGYLHLYGSTVYDNGNYLHLGANYTTTDGSLTVNGTAGINDMLTVNSGQWVSVLGQNSNSNGWGGYFTGTNGVGGVSNNGGWAGVFNSGNSQNGVSISNNSGNAQLCLNGTDSAHCTTTLPSHAFGGIWGTYNNANPNAACVRGNPYTGNCSCPSWASSSSLITVSYPSPYIYSYYCYE